MSSHTQVCAEVLYRVVLPLAIAYLGDLNTIVSRSSFHNLNYCVDDEVLSFARKLTAQ
jgi:hypothetical protein